MEIGDIIDAGFMVDHFDGDSGKGHMPNNRSRQISFTLSTGKVLVSDNNRTLLNARIFDSSKLETALSTLVP